MRTLRTLAGLVKIEHTVFALPFAFAGLALAIRDTPGVGWSVSLVVWVTVAMVGARTLAMGLNRVIDASIDARNPRTAMREIPAGKVSRAQVWALCAVALALLEIWRGRTREGRAADEPARSAARQRDAEAPP